MTKRIVITPRASQDIDEHFAYIAQNNSDAALRFFESVRHTFAKLAQMSGMGRPYPVSNPRLEGLRKWARCDLGFLMRRFSIESALNHEEQEDS